MTRDVSMLEPECNVFIVCRCKDKNGKVLGYGVTDEDLDPTAKRCEKITTIIENLKTGITYCSRAENDPDTIARVEERHLDDSIIPVTKKDKSIRDNLSSKEKCSTCKLTEKKHAR